MRIDMALLCDAATIRENLFHILGGGITNINVQKFPGTLDAALAIRIMLHPTEADVPHKLQVVLQDEDGKRLFDIGGDFNANPGGALRVGDEVNVQLAIKVKGPLPRTGRHSFELLIDGTHQASVPFHVTDAQV